MSGPFNSETHFEITPQDFFPQVNSLGWQLAMGGKFPVHERLNDRRHYLSITLEANGKADRQAPRWDVISEAHLPDTNRADRHVIQNVCNFPAKQIMFAVGEACDRQRHYHYGNKDSTVIPYPLFDEMKLYQRNGCLPYIMTSLEIMLPQDLNLTQETAVKKTHEYFASVKTNKETMEQSLARRGIQGFDDNLEDLLFNAKYCTQFYALATPQENLPECYALLASGPLNSNRFMMYCDNFVSAQYFMGLLEDTYIRPTFDADPEVKDTVHDYLLHYLNWGPGNAAQKRVIANN